MNSNLVTNTTFSWKVLNFFQRYIKISLKEIALMGLLLAVFTILKYLTFIFFKGPLNFGIELLFWIVIGLIFGPFKGSLFAFFCDFVFTLFTSGIVFWMIEYAAVAPVVALLSWAFYQFYQVNKQEVIWIALSLNVMLVIASITLFSLQLQTQFRYEDVKQVFPWVAWTLIIFLNTAIVGFSSFCLINFYLKQNWKFIKWLYIFSLVILVVVLFRWLWGPYAFIAFFSQKLAPGVAFDFWTKYWLTLTGIATKSFLTIPLATFILVPLIHVIDVNRKYDLSKNAYF